MKQYARIISKPNSQQVKAMVQKHSACGKCGHCSEDDNLVLTLDNNLDVEVGDIVTIEMEGSNILGAAFLVYFVPLIALIVGYIGAQYLGMESEVARISLSGLLFAISFIGARKFGEMKKEDYRAQMQEIVN